MIDFAKIESHLLFLIKYSERNVSKIIQVAKCKGVWHVDKEMNK